MRPKNESKYLYIAYDDEGLPRYIEDSPSELAAKVGSTSATIMSYCNHHNQRKDGTCKYARVLKEDEEGIEE